MSGLVGQHIGKYRVTRQVGRGGMGTVYAAVDETLHRDVALKVLNADLDDPTVARRFRAEAIAVARLNHPGIATIFELVERDGQWLMVMEFVRGETLEDTLAGSQALPVGRAADVTMQLLAALAHAHAQGVVHRDLKPSNIMLSPGGGAKIMDFGIARISGAEQLTSAGFTMGTPVYMAPEQVAGGDIDARTDLYAVGILLFQMTTGALPFDGGSAVQVAQARLNDPPRRIRDVDPAAPEWLAQTLDIALAREPADRFQSATLFRQAIRRGLAGVPIDGEISTPLASPVAQHASSTALHIVKGHGVAADTDAPTEQTPPPRPVDAALPAAAPAFASGVHVPASAGAGEVGRGMPTTRAAGVAVILVGVAAGLWWMTRNPAGPAPGAEPPPIDAAGPAVPGDIDRASRADGTPGLRSGAPSSASSGQAQGGPGASTGAANSGGPASASASRPSRAAALPPPRGQPVAPDPTPAVFRGVRALVLNGRSAEERPVVLAFADGLVRLFDDDGRSTLAELPYGDVTAAAYTRGRNPRWYPTLAGPPIDTDMPGGLFRGNRHWLALQSRAAWMIVRMNDNDWQQITETVTARLGLRVETLQPE